ncbi:MAG: divalent-cation tolerance protein CutA [FCB group bacterium]|nr:divalent-cation tolerance protein CutA [FCB group bacterium]MBL7028140.1 divalent-cation tolerance protein CutA [Candidatus Neomarinimicrobiota bacterium]MBL7122920.1 divalent-cation tolerance protein CutA [Candidatus Neomarinimicrobiota bacterium]
MSESCCIVTTTIDNAKIASTLAKGVLAKHLAACAQIIPGVTSHYEWQGQLEASQELLLQFKTTEKCARKLMEYIKKAHTYDTPEITMIRIGEIDSDYEKWLKMAVVLDIS